MTAVKRGRRIIYSVYNDQPASRHVGRFHNHLKGIHQQLATKLLTLK